MIVKKPWGKEAVLVNTELYCCKILTCKDDVWSSEGRWHYHGVKDETFRVLEGIFELEVEEEGEVRHLLMTRNQTMRLKPGTKHRFRSPSCKVLEVSTRDDAEDTYRVE